MDKKLPARPNLEHLRSQAKSLLSQLNEGDLSAAQTFIEHLPAAQKMSPEEVRQAGLRLADAQSAIARKTGFASWPNLARHVEQLRQFEGSWEFLDLEVDGEAVPAAALTNSCILMDGDRFRTESPGANYEGIFTIDVEQEPHHIDIEFVEGPEAGNWSYGIYELTGDHLKICLGLTGANRPEGFVTTLGSSYALENLRRSSKSRPKGVEGGSSQAVANLPQIDESEFAMEMTPLLQKLQGDWVAVETVLNGKSLPEMMLKTGSRSTVGNETTVVFGGQTMVHAKVRIDETQSPAAVDYLNIGGSTKGQVTLGILGWIDGDVRFCIASPGQPRPEGFTSEPGSGQTLSRWRPK
jgi:uncharacterized protein (TIGR03067 family)